MIQMEGEKKETKKRERERERRQEKRNFCTRERWPLFY